MKNKIEIRDTKQKNREYKISLIIDVINIYLRYLVVFPNKRNLRKQLLIGIKGMFIYLKNENIILNALNEANISFEDYIKILEDLDSLFDEAYDYYDHVLSEFETTLQLHDFERIVYKDSTPKFLNDQKRDEFLQFIASLERKAPTK